MALVIATGSNLDNRLQNLEKAKEALSASFKLLEESNVYVSKAVDYQNQPDFYNQVLIFDSPNTEPNELMSALLSIESTLGRTRDIDKGPRVIDIDLLFFDEHTFNTEHLTLPHPRLFERSFVVFPLMELSYFNVLKNKYDFHTNFDNSASVLKFS